MNKNLHNFFSDMNFQKYLMSLIGPNMLEFHTKNWDLSPNPFADNQFFNFSVTAQRKIKNQNFQISISQNGSKN